MTIQERINTLFIATDQHNWATVEQCFAKAIIIDYSSMTGQAASTTNPQQIVENWQAFLPNFEHTHHQLGNFIIQEQDKKATAFCYGTATHYLENEQESIWTVVGSYDFDLIQVCTDWKVCKMKFNFKYQSGNLALPQLASNAPIPSTAEQNKDAVRQFFKALEDKNIDTLVDLFAEEAVHINPYHSGIFPKGANGKAGIRAYWTPTFPNFDVMEFPIEEIYAMENPNMVFVKYKGSIQLKNNAGYYNNDYYSTFKFNDQGKIIEYVEIFNPIEAAKGFGLLDKIQA